MIVTVFERRGNQLELSPWCTHIGWLNIIIREYPLEYNKVYAYLHYMTHPNPDENPYFNLKDSEKEEKILRDIGADFSPEDELIILAKNELEKQYDTPVMRAYKAGKKLVENMEEFMSNTKFTSGRDGSSAELRAVAKDITNIRKMYSQAYNEMIEEVKMNVRGQKRPGYDIGKDDDQCW